MSQPSTSSKVTQFSLETSSTLPRIGHIATQTSHYYQLSASPTNFSLCFINFYTNKIVYPSTSVFKTSTQVALKTRSYHQKPPKISQKALQLETPFDFYIFIDSVSNLRFDNMSIM
jgi:hypothetical protein